MREDGSNGESRKAMSNQGRETRDVVSAANKVAGRRVRSMDL